MGIVFAQSFLQLIDFVDHFFLLDGSPANDKLSINFEGKSVCVEKSNGKAITHHIIDANGDLDLTLLGENLKSLLEKGVVFFIKKKKQVFKVSAKAVI